MNPLYVFGVPIWLAGTIIIGAIYYRYMLKEEPSNDTIDALWGATFFAMLWPAWLILLAIASPFLLIAGSIWLLGRTGTNTKEEWEVALEEWEAEHGLRAR